MKISFFIDEQGKRLSLKNANHVELANRIVEENPTLKEEFLKSGKKSAVEFLMRSKRYIAGVEENKEARKNITYDSQILLEKQKKWITYYRKKGYHFLDLAEFRKKAQEANLGRGED